MPARPNIVLVFITLILAALIPAAAHHSVAGQFDYRNSVKLEGIVTKVDWINPHIYIYLDVKDGNGTVTEWRMETLPPAMMRRVGISKKDLQATGETLVIDGLSARDGTRHLGFITRITFPDGHYYQLDRDPNAER